MRSGNSTHTEIKLLRLAKNLPKSAVAQHLGISRPTYALVERGQRELTLTQLYSLITLFDADPNALLPTAMHEPGMPAPSLDYDMLKETTMKCVMFGSDSTGRISKAKLAKLVYLADFAWYYEHEKPLTGATYICTAKGPVAEAFYRAVDELYEEGVLTIQPIGTAIMIHAIEQQPARLLDADAVELLQRIGAKWHNRSTQSLLAFVRAQGPWKHSSPGDRIPYDLILNEPPGGLY